MGAKPTCHELTFVSMHGMTKKGYDSENILINVKYSPFEFDDIILSKKNPNYEKIYNTLKKNNTYRFIISLCNRYSNNGFFDSLNKVYIEDICDQVTYLSTIKITKLLDMKQLDLYKNIDCYQVEHECDNGYTALYDVGDNNKIDDFDRGKKLRLIISNDNVSDLQVGNYYMVKFKKSPVNHLYLICYYDKIYENGKEMTKLL